METWVSAWTPWSQPGHTLHFGAFTAFLGTILFPGIQDSLVLSGAVLYDSLRRYVKRLTMVNTEISIHGRGKGVIILVGSVVRCNARGTQWVFSYLCLSLLLASRDPRLILDVRLRSLRRRPYNRSNKFKDLSMSSAFVVLLPQLDRYDSLDLLKESWFIHLHWFQETGLVTLPSFSILLHFPASSPI